MLYLPVPPDSDTGNPGLEFSLSFMFNVAVCSIVVVGVKVTLKVQLDAGASVEPQVVVKVNSLASLPVTVALMEVSAAVPWLLTVVLRVFDDPVPTSPKGRLVGEILVACAVPVKDTGKVPSLSVIFSAAVSLPEPVGWNLTV